MNLKKTVERALKAREDMNKALNYGERSPHATACMGIVHSGCKDEGGDGFHLSPNQACHAGMNNTGYGGFPIKSKRQYVVSSIQEHKVDKDDAILYINWLVNEGPYAPVFVTKDPEDILENGYICDADHPSNLIAGALINSRIMWEYTEVLKSFLKMVKLGVNSNLAMFMAHIYRYNGSFYKYQMSGHCSLDGYDVRIHQIVNFVKAEMINPNKNYSDESAYVGVHMLWGKSDIGARDEVVNLMARMVKDFNKPVGKVVVGKKYVNPFEKAMGLLADKKKRREEDDLRFTDEQMVYLCDRFIKEYVE